MRASNGETIRIGFGLGTNSTTNEPVRLGELIEALELHGFDSIWFSERVSGPGLDPLVAMTWAAARTEKLKFGPSVMVVPGRNPVLLAKSIASLDRVSNGRVLPGFGLGAASLGEHQAFGVDRADRGPWFNEALPLIRRLWTEESVSHHGERFQLEGVRVLPKPVQDPLEIWLGGIASSELRRVGRFGDGWLPSFCTAGDVADAIPVIDRHAAEAGRPPIDRGHFGALVIYSTDGTMPENLARAIRVRRPELSPEEVIVVGRESLPTRIEEFCDAGATKFVVMPAQEPEHWPTELEQLAEAVLGIPRLTPAIGPRAGTRARR